MDANKFNQPNGDIEISQPPADTVTELAFSPKANLLAASSWDNEVRIWEIQNNGTSMGKAAYSHEAPALCCVWSRDGTKVASGGADKAGRMIDIGTGQSVQVAQHDAPISCIKFVEAENASPILATAGWDKVLKYWDLRQPSPIGTVNLPERAYAMDCNNPMLVVATAERKIVIFDMNNPTTPFETAESPLKWQTRTVSCFPNKEGYAVGSIEGRVGIQYVDIKDKDKCFSFKCHRENKGLESLVHSINTICHHPGFGTFATASNDASFAIWDKDARRKISSHTKLGGPIVSAAFNGDGSLFAYALGYDWSKGYKGNTSDIKNTIMLHAVSEQDVKPTPK
ncbi:RNA export factor gle2 [Kickxella alabastrina]|uniref:RNA export factor gle2 n=1 Tax=Kickxella alabastrina TaxID=61397 RepID=A0ACC1IUU6_9FUNG|nr:RNA export factor gle2 [Kickxella alabastrina]